MTAGDRFRTRVGGGVEVDLRPDLRLIADCTERAPFSPDLAVLEEDTHRVLSAPTRISSRRLSLDRALVAVAADTGCAPGSIRRSGRSLLAVVHDLSADPTCRPEWIAAALDEVLAEADRTEARTLAIPLLGTVHGRIPESTSIALLRAAIDRAAIQSLERIWLVVPEDRLDEVGRHLEDW